MEDKFELEPDGDHEKYITQVDEAMSDLLDQYEVRSEELASEVKDTLYDAVETAAQHSYDLLKVTESRTKGWINYLGDKNEQITDEFLSDVDEFAEECVSKYRKKSESSQEFALKSAERAGLPAKHLNDAMEEASIDYTPSSESYEGKSEVNPGLPSVEEEETRYDFEDMNVQDTRDHLSELEEEGEVDWKEALEAENKGKDRKTVKDFIDRRLE